MAPISEPAEQKLKSHIYPALHSAYGNIFEESPEKEIRDSLNFSFLSFMSIHSLIETVQKSHLTTKICGHNYYEGGGVLFLGLSPININININILSLILQVAPPSAKENCQTTSKTARFTVDFHPLIVLLKTNISSSFFLWNLYWNWNRFQSPI